jgi:hypothetical protein
MTDYYDVDDSGQEWAGNMSATARKGKTELQKAALKATQTEKEMFESTDQHKRFKAFEDIASPIDRTENGKMMLAWYLQCIKNATAMNRKVRNTNMEKLLRDFGDEVKRLSWWGNLTQEDRDLILQKKKVANTSALQPAKSLPRPTYVKKTDDRINDLIAKFEALSGCNIRVTTNAKDFATKILDDGRDPDVFIQWIKNHEWYSEHLDIFKNLSKVWELWPKAFEEGEALVASTERKSSFYA